MTRTLFKQTWPVVYTNTGLRMEEVEEWADERGMRRMTEWDGDGNWVDFVFTPNRFRFSKIEDALAFILRFGAVGYTTANMGNH